MDKGEEGCPGPTRGVIIPISDMERIAADEQAHCIWRWTMTMMTAWPSGPVTEQSLNKLVYPAIPAARAAGEHVFSHCGVTLRPHCG